MIDKKFNTVLNYVEFLVSIGRKVGCFTQSEKDSQKLTIAEQCKLSGMLSKEKSMLYLKSIIPSKMDRNFYDILENFLVEENDITIDELLTEVKKICIEMHYDEVEKLLSENQTTYDKEMSYDNQEGNSI